MIDQARDVIARTLGQAEIPCVTSSFQAECVVLTHMLREVRPDIPVLFLETFHHFAETLAYRDDIARRWHLNLVNLKANILPTRDRATLILHKNADHGVGGVSLRRR